MNPAYVTVGPRTRKDLGDIESLAESMSEVGLLHPIVVTENGHLIAGARRLAAARLLGWDDVPARVVGGFDDAMRALLAERDENQERKDFSPLEALEIARALEPIERAEAKERQLAGRPPENFSEGGETLVKVAAAVGLSRPTLAKIAEVAQAAEVDPETFGPIAERMDETGKVDPAYQEVRRIQQADAPEEVRPAMKRPVCQGVGHSDHFQTPPEALRPLRGFLKDGWRVWECAWGAGNLATSLTESGLEVVTSDVSQGQDFLTWEPDAWDVIVSNPPYSLKDDFLARAYALGKPFAFLLPLTALEGKRRQALYREHGVELVLFPFRLNFEVPNGGTGSSSWFATAWYTHGLDIGRDLTFWTSKDTDDEG